MQERPKQLEGDLRGRLVQRMRERGVEDPEAVRLMIEWTREEEKTVPANQPECGRATTLFNIKRARLYRDARCIGEAIENYEHALIQLGNDQDRDFAADTAEIIYAEIDALPQD